MRRRTARVAVTPSRIQGAGRRKTAHNADVRGKRKANKTSPRGEPVRPGLTLDVFSPAVEAELTRIQGEMPFYMWSVDMLAATRECVGECHRPSLWCLAGFMIDFALQIAGAKEKKLSKDWQFYPMRLEDRRLWIQSHSRGGGQTFNEMEVWGRARNRILDTVSSLCGVAAQAGDAYFFQRWGDVCNAVGEIAFDIRDWRGSQTWQNGRFSGEMQNFWISDSKRTTRSPQRLKILNARLALFMSLSRIPFDDEVADYLIAQNPTGKQSRTSLIKAVTVTCKRLALSRLVRVHADNLKS